MSYVGEQLSVCQSVRASATLPVVAVVAGQQEPQEQGTRTPIGVQPVALPDMVGWQRANPSDEGAFVGPIRVQCTRPKL